MQEPYYWYVLYVKTNTESRVMNDIVRFATGKGFAYEFEPFCPESEYYYRGNKGKRLGKTYRKRPLFPNYVFVETTMPPDEFLKEFSHYIYASTEIIRLLMSGDKTQIALPLEERQRLEFLLRGKRCFEKSIGVIVGDSIVIRDGPLKDFAGAITKINRHNRYAEIEVEMFGGKTRVQVALEIVEKI